VPPANRQFDTALLLVTNYFYFCFDK